MSPDHCSILTFAAGICHNRLPGASNQQPIPGRIRPLKLLHLGVDPSAVQGGGTLEGLSDKGLRGPVVFISEWFSRTAAGGVDASESQDRDTSTRLARSGSAPEQETRAGSGR